MYSFRLPIRLSPNHRLAVESVFTKLHGPTERDWLIIKAHNGEDLKSSSEVLLQGPNFQEEAEAMEAAERAVDAIKVAFSRLLVAADFGGSWKAVRAQVSNEIGTMMGRPMVIERHALQVYPTNPPPSFGRHGGGGLTLHPPIGGLEALYRKAHASGIRLTDRERLAYDLFALSWFAYEVRARFLLLVMGIEALVEDVDQPSRIGQIVDELSECVRTDERLEAAERDSLVNRLRWLQKRSIRQGCLQLISQRFPLELMDGEQPRKVFDHAYSIRSALAHGTIPQPSEEEVRAAVPKVEKILSEILARGIRG